MFVPPYDAVLKSLGTSREALKGETEISIPVDFLKFLLMLVVKQGDFNESGYLERNPDVADSVRQNRIASGYFHYLTYGYLEGRRGGTSEVDEAWYRETNPDVADAIRSGNMLSAKAHYLQGGDNELRAPNAAAQRDSLAWKAATKREVVEPAQNASSYLASAAPRPPVTSVKGKENPVKGKENPVKGKEKSRGLFKNWR